MEPVTKPHFLAIWTVKTLGGKLLRMYSSSQEKSNRLKSRWSLKPSSVRGKTFCIFQRHVGVPPRDTNMAFPQGAL